MSRADARTILAALVHDGIDPARLTPQARDEIRAAFDVVLRLAEKESAA